MKLCEPEIPKIYWVNCYTYKCKHCGNEFNILFPNGNYIVKFREIDGNNIRWLPTYGKGGYLDLMTKLLPGHSLNDEITVKKAKAFIKELNKNCEQGDGGNGFDISITKFNCTNCNSEDTKYLSETVLTNPTLSWLRISSNLMT